MQSEKRKTKVQGLKFFKRKFLVLSFSFTFCALSFTLTFAQDADIEFTLDVNSDTVSLPEVLKPNIDLSGRGFHRKSDWPQTLAAVEVLDVWEQDIGFSGMYRIQYNLWEINELAKDKDLQDKLLSNYEKVIGQITKAGGIVLLDIYSMPAGLGKVLDKKSAPLRPEAFKQLIKREIKRLSCDKRYNIWYEVWSAPDLDDFFLGRRQDYLNLYRVVAQAIKELEAETKVYIPVGGPATSWWFQGINGNTVITPERSLIYELIRFCFRYKLPLDFISWHAYSTDPKAEKEITTYNKSAVGLIRDWLSYFNFDRNTPLIVDEWNYDREANVLPERQDKSNICASYIVARLKNIYAAGLDYQLYFSLEDFQNNKEGVVRNVGAFWFDSEFSKYKGGTKATYNIFRMLSNLGNDMFVLPKLDDEFVGIIATKAQDYIALLIYNYIDPEVVRSHLSRNIARLNKKERRVLLNIIKSDRLKEIMSGRLDISSLRTTNRLKALLKKTQELNDQARKFKAIERNIKIDIKNLEGDYLYQRYTVDSSCSATCVFSPREKKQITASSSYREILTLQPYSVNMIILKEKPQNVQTPAAQEAADEQKN